ncbi:hypothetical protein BKA63DRAFT_572767 [Paraphoma chrysanthemicola]|nr:hypothetical protein BKA63DRAFT_572767 [Paraphoma chrysanthemicola]
MPSVAQPRLKRVSSSTTSHVDTATHILTESPATESPPVDGSLSAVANTDAGLPFYEQYIRELDDYRTIFNKNMKNKPVKHDRVHVLIWTWGKEIDDLGVQEEVDRLEQVFKEKYYFGVERQVLDDLEKADHQLNEYLSSFMKRHDESNTLLIFYYAGHGLYEDNTVMLTGTTKQQSAVEKVLNSVAWSSAEHNIKAKRADVLVIFDCCHAGGFGGYDARAARQTPFQCIAACGASQRTPKPGTTSFTSALIWALEEMRPHAPFTSIALLHKIREYNQLPDSQDPTLLKRDEYNDSMVWIAPQRMKKSGPTSTKSERRDPSHEYFDLRFNFYRRVYKSDAERVAKCLSRLIHHDKDFEAKHIVLLDKTSMHSKAIRSLASPVHKKRKRSTTSSLNLSPMAPESPNALIQYHGELPEVTIDDALVVRPSKRLRSTDIQMEPAEPQNAFYHLRMALHCSLQNVTSQIGRIADHIRPRTVQVTDGDMSDID